MVKLFINLLDALDKRLMLYLNYDGGGMMDDLCQVLSSRLLWVLPALLFVAYAFRRWHYAKAIIAVLCAAVTVVLCDQISSSVIKPMFMRLRPSHCIGLETMLHYVDDYRGGIYGFVSSHAANAFGIVTFVSLLLRRRWVTISLFVLASCVGYSRIYLGVHYPGDVLAGALLGCAIGYGMYAVYLRLMGGWLLSLVHQWRQRKPHHPKGESICQLRQIVRLFSKPLNLSDHH